MIKSIQIKDVAIFSPEGVHIKNLKPVSLIYGANGSGKTTISNFFDNPGDSNYSSCSLEWRGNQPISTYVYNKNFREQSFFKGDIPGVFTLGRESVEQQHTLKNKKEEIEEVRKKAREEKKRIKGFNNQLAEEGNRFRKTIWDSFLKPYKTDFREAFKGASYKKTFEKRLLEEYQKNTVKLLSKEELIKQAKTIFGDQPQLIDSLPLLVVDRLKEIEEMEIWAKPIVGKKDVPIAELINDLGNNDWVDKGQNYIKGKSCPFCQQETINEDFKRQLEDFFDDGYKSKLTEVASLKKEYEELSLKLIDQVHLLEQREEADSNTKLDWVNFKTEIELLGSRINETRMLMSEKLAEPSRKFLIVALTDLYDQLNDRIIEANKTIAAHNEVVNNFHISHKRLVQSVWRFLVEEARPIIEAHIKAMKGIKKSMGILTDTSEKTIEKGLQLKKEIEEITKGTTGVEFSELEMNKLLESFGFNSFKIVRSPKNANCYQIQREDGSLVESTLSEGEVTFVTFLYFYQLAKGGHTKSAVNERRVLIVDDPISSLDSNVLFVVSSLLRRYVDEIRSNKGNIVQLILLTHNSYFHKQMAIVEGRNQSRSDTAFWILRKGRKWAAIEYYGEHNPISSTYEILWNELKSNENKSSVMLQNAMRRILEYYFTVFGQFSNIKKLSDEFDTIEEQMICKSLISWVHDGSHDIADELHVSDNDETKLHYKNVFRKLFEVNHQLGHYNQMMGISNEIESEV